MGTGSGGLRWCPRCHPSHQVPGLTSNPLSPGSGQGAAVDVESWVSGQSLLPRSLWGTETAPQNAALASARPHMAARERGTAQAGLGLEEPGPCRGWGWGHLTPGPLKSSLECRPSSRGSALNREEDGQSALLWLPLGLQHLSCQPLRSCSLSSAEPLRLQG